MPRYSVLIEDRIDVWAANEEDAAAKALDCMDSEDCIVWMIEEDDK